MKKRYLLIVLSVAAVAVAAIGGTMAAKSDENVSITADISEKTVGVKANKTNIGSIPVVPGAEREVKYSVLNDAGKSNGTNSDNGDMIFMLGSMWISSGNKAGTISRNMAL